MVEKERRLRCWFCGTVDELPADAMGRALELKRRVAEAAKSVAQLNGLERVLAHVFEDRGALWRVGGVWLVIAALVLASTVAQPAISMLRDGAVTVALALPSIAIALFLVALAIVPLAWGRARYKRLVRPWIGARPPIFKGHPVRCRACGADLVVHKSAFVTCMHCSTTNLVTSDLPERAGRLEAEAALYRARAFGLQQELTRAGTAMRRVFWVLVVVGVAGVFGAGALSSWLLRMLS